MKDTALVALMVTGIVLACLLFGALITLFYAWLIRIVASGVFDHPIEFWPSVAAALLFSMLTGVSARAVRS
jgi:hypothetical protein